MRPNVHPNLVTKMVQYLYNLPYIQIRRIQQAFNSLDLAITGKLLHTVDHFLPSMILSNGYNTK